jgi:hypothetical protein
MEYCYIVLCPEFKVPRILEREKHRPTRVRVFECRNIHNMSEGEAGPPLMIYTVPFRAILLYLGLLTRANVYFL